MSYFGTCLDELIRRKKFKAVELAKMSGVQESMISRYRKGEHVWVSAEDLESLAKAISQDPAEQAELLYAHLRDECHGPGSDLIEISIRGGQLQERAPFYQVKLAPETEQCLIAIRERIATDNDVKEIIEGLGNLLMHGDARTIKERAETSPSSETKPVAQYLLNKKPPKRPPQK